MSLTHEDVLKIMKIVDECDYDEIRLETGDLKIHLRKSAGCEGIQSEMPAKTHPIPSAMPAVPRATEAAVAPSPMKKSPEDDPLAEGLVSIRAPMLGTFYRAPSPTEKPFVEVGDQVNAETTVCLVEVMKLFTSVTAGVAGTVKEILVENGSMVEYSQVLLLIEQELAATGGKRP